MATDFQEIEEYITTKWYNYNPPSIDQDNLRHIEDNIKLNRDTINEIIRRLGVVPSTGNTAEDQQIYDTSIYDTLIDFRDKIKHLQDTKLDIAVYEAERGDISNLQGGSNLVEAINNRLRKDQDDVSQFSYTFKKLTLTDSLSVATTSLFTGAITAKSTITATGKITANGGVEATDLKVTGDSVMNGNLNVGKRITGTGGLTVSGASSNITGGLTVDNLTVTGNIIVGNNAVVLRNNGKIENTSTITSNGAIYTRDIFYSTGECIYFHWNSSPAHRLYVHGGSQYLEGGDAFIQTVN